MKAADFGKVAVLMGGTSAERAISLKSGAAVLAALRSRGIDAHPLDPVDIQLLLELRGQGFDRVFICLHGRGGEDGVIQGALETLEVPYTGSGVLGSALGMDKYRCKLLWQGAGLPTPEFVVLRREEDLERVATLGFPVIVKPIHEGSSIGMGRANDPQQLRQAWQTAARFDHLVLAERWVEGQEYTCAVLGNQTLPLIRLETPRTFYDFEAKYSSNTTRYHCPCGLPEAVETRFRTLALKAFQVAGGSGWGRVDLLTDSAGEPWLLETNTAPGMTDHSLVPMAARVAGISFDELVWRILCASVRSEA